jgi:glycosyltransferase involved in cell wall biosynthesis
LNGSIVQLFNEKTMLRILFIIPTLDRSGAEKQLTLLATRLPRDEFQIEVCALTRGGPYEAELQAAGIPVTVLGKRLKIDPVAAIKLSRLIGRGRFDIVHTWLFAANWHGRAMAWLRRVPILVASERCADEWKGSIELTLDRMLAPRTDAIVANSQAVFDFYAAHGVDPAKLVLIPNGIVPEPPPVVDRSLVLKEFDVEPDAQVVGYVGRLWPQKRVRDLIWAVEVIRNIKPKIMLLIVGDGPERLDLVDYAEKVTIQDRVRFLGHREDVARLMAAMDVFVLASEFEGMPNSVMEAMNAGLPVVATNIPGNNELVVDGETGYLVPVGDTKSLASQMNRLFDDSALRTSLGLAGQRRVRELFGVEKMVEGHVRLYRNLARKKLNRPTSP